MEADKRLPDSQEDETQIEPPAFAEEGADKGEMGDDKETVDDKEIEKTDFKEEVEDDRQNESNVTSQEFQPEEISEGKERLHPDEEEEAEEEEEPEEGMMRDSIPSFDEWKEQMLQKAIEEQEKQYGEGTKSVVEKSVNNCDLCCRGNKPVWKTTHRR